MTTTFRTHMLLGFTVLAGALSGCIVETTTGGGSSSGACLDNQYFTVEWGVDHGPGTVPLTCSALSAAGWSVVLTTNAAAPYTTMPAEYNVSCVDGLLCGGLPCNAAGSTGSGVPAGTEVITAAMVDTSGNVVNTADARPGYPLPRCNRLIVGYTFVVP